MNGISTLVKETPEKSFALSLLCEDTMEMKLSMSQEVGPFQTLNLLRT